MARDNDADETRDAADQVEADLDEDEEDDEEEQEEEDDRPDDAVTCPFCDQAFARGTCEACGGRRWLRLDTIDDMLGSNRVPCVACSGEGASDSFGPSSFACEFCLGTGSMPATALREIELTQYACQEQDWSGVDLRGLSLRGGFFESCDFSRVNLEGADLTEASFEDCDFTGANPERAASLDGTVLTVYGLSKEQVATCAARGATVERLDEEEESE